MLCLSTDHVTLLGQVRLLKNDCIGNKVKKQAYLAAGMLERLVELIRAAPSDELVSQSVAAAASLTFAPTTEELSSQLAQSDLVPTLWTALCTGSASVAVAAGRAVRMVLVRHHQLIKQLSNDSQAQLVSILAAEPVGPLHSEAAIILGTLSSSHSIELPATAMGRLLQLMQISSSPAEARCQRAVIRTLAVLTRHDTQAVGALQQCSGAIHVLWQAIAWQSAEDRLNAVRCLAHLAVYESVNQSNNLAESARVLALVFSLLEDDSFGPKGDALFLVADLLKNSPQLQQDASNLTAVMKLAAVVTSHSSSPCGPRLVEGALLSLAALCATHEHGRYLVVQAQVLPTVVTATEHPEPAIRVAACEVLKNLSRSVRTLRGAMGEPKIGQCVAALLFDVSPLARHGALAVLCNIVLQFSPLREVVIASGTVLPVVVRLALDHSEPSSRVLAVWALANLAFKAELAVKTSVVQQLSVKDAVLLATDTDPLLQQHALTLMSNLASGDEVHVQLLLDWGGSELMDLVSLLLQHSDPKVVKQVLHIVCNIASSSELHKLLLMEAECVVPQAVIHLGSEDADTKLAAVWCIINLSWPQLTGSEQRVDQLRALGCDTILEKMSIESETGTQNRVQLALAHLGSTNCANGEDASTKNCDGTML